MNKKVILTLIVIVILIISIIFIKMYYKSSNSGNNIISNILNIESYEATATITINSNKNTNTYTVKQQYIKDNNLFRQEVIEPSNIAGLTIIYDGKNLKIEDLTNNLAKTYENYPYIEENSLSLNGFIEDYKNSNNSKSYEQDGNIVLEAKVKDGNKYTSYKKLYIDKSNKKISKLEIQDVSQKVVVYILYNEIEINNL